MASLESLPVEIKIEILKQLPDIKSLINLIKVFPGAFRAYYGSEFNQNIIIKSILGTELGDYLPMAIKRLNVLRKPDRPLRPYDIHPAPEYKSMIQQFCNEESQRRNTGRPIVELDWFTLEKAVEMSAFHTVALQWVDILAKSISRGPFNGKTFGFLTPSSMGYLDDQERHRVANILYVTELVSMLFPVKYHFQWSDGDRLWRIFWADYKPWEYCQYVEMQGALTDLCESKFWKHYLYYNTPIGINLRLVDIDMITTMKLHRICQVVALQAGLHALLDVVHTTGPSGSDSGKDIYQPQILDVLRDLNAEIMDWSRYIETSSTYGITRAYKWWLGLGYRTEQDYLGKTDQVYFVKFTNNPEDPDGIDEAPLRCWLFDLMRYGRRPSHNNIVRWPRDNGTYVMTSFLSSYRWESQGWQLPSLADLKKEAEQHVLNERGHVIPRPEMYYEAPNRYEVGNYPVWID
ncbi:hypothetical protein F5B19DRAFT_490652 [Rostrohypoxylon terebratum]|nr:hypothetical protein F5B19DRAFT_490652 [Rostrohypoxylon terebratum]